MGQWPSRRKGSAALDLDQHESDTQTPEAFYTATPGYGAHIETPGRVKPNTEYGRVLNENKLIVAKKVESNWSGRGQNVEFKESSEIPLKVEKVIGHSSTALIESVLCRRIRLARKSIRCNRNAKLKDLVKEVSYLRKLRHPHIIQLVGTYLRGNTFAILLYPVATGDLNKFLAEWRPVGQSYSQSKSQSNSRNTSTALLVLHDLARFCFCLTHALRHMHEKGILHMDIKPGNILVHERRKIGEPCVRSVYLTDFGISRAFTEDEGSQTASSAAMTKRWCSPEVAAHERHGRAADVFSMGCVLLSMYTVLVGESLVEFEEFRAKDDGIDAFHLKLSRVREWMRRLEAKVHPHLKTPEQPDSQVWHSRFLGLLADMIEENPERRPTSTQVAKRMESITILWPSIEDWQGGNTYGWWEHKWNCCSRSPDLYRVAEEDEISEYFDYYHDTESESE